MKEMKNSFYTNFVKYTLKIVFTLGFLLFSGAEANEHICVEEDQDEINITCFGSRIYARNEREPGECLTYALGRLSELEYAAEITNSGELNDYRFFSVVARSLSSDALVNIVCQQYTYESDGQSLTGSYLIVSYIYPIENIKLYQENLDALVGEY
jgi:hypothetical protein